MPPDEELEELGLVEVPPVPLRPYTQELPSAPPKRRRWLPYLLGGTAAAAGLTVLAFRTGLAARLFARYRPGLTPMAAEIARDLTRWAARIEDESLALLRGMMARAALTDRTFIPDAVRVPIYAALEHFGWERALRGRVPLARRWRERIVHWVIHQAPSELTARARGISETQLESALVRLQSALVFPPPSRAAPGTLPPELVRLRYELWQQHQQRIAQWKEILQQHVVRSHEARQNWLARLLGLQPLTWEQAQARGLLAPTPLILPTLPGTQRTTLGQWIATTRAGQLGDFGRLVYDPLVFVDPYGQIVDLRFLRSLGERAERIASSIRVPVLGFSLSQILRLETWTDWYRRARDVRVLPAGTLHLLRFRPGLTAQEAREQIAREMASQFGLSAERARQIFGLQEPMVRVGSDVFSLLHPERGPVFTGVRGVSPYSLLGTLTARMMGLRTWPVQPPSPGLLGKVRRSLDLGLQARPSIFQQILSAVRKYWTPTADIHVLARLRTAPPGQYEEAALVLLNLVRRSLRPLPASAMRALEPYLERQWVVPATAASARDLLAYVRKAHPALATQLEAALRAAAPDLTPMLGQAAAADAALAQRLAEYTARREEAWRLVRMQTQEDVLRFLEVLGAEGLAHPWRTAEFEQSALAQQIAREWRAYVFEPKGFLESKRVVTRRIPQFLNIGEILPESAEEIPRIEDVRMLLQQEIMRRMQTELTWSHPIAPLLAFTPRIPREARQAWRRLVADLMARQAGTRMEEQAQAFGLLVRGLPEGATVLRELRELVAQEIPWYAAERYTPPPERLLTEGQWVTPELWVREPFRPPSLAAHLRALAGDAQAQAQLRAQWSAFFRQFVAGRETPEYVTAATFVPYFFLSRINETLAYFGLGLSPAWTGSALRLWGGLTLLRWLPAIALPFYAGYLDWEIENLTGFSPKKAIARSLAGLHILAAQARDLLGITSLAKEMSPLFPGLEVIFEIPGLAFFDPTKSAEEVAEEYERGRYPIRRGRWWLLSSSPIQGERVEVFAPSWLKQIESDYYIRGVYGSRETYYAYGPFPVPRYPLNWLRRFFTDPYWLERMGYYERPYPVTGPIPELHEIPIIGPLVSATVGRILKPPRRMHVAELEQWQRLAAMYEQGLLSPEYPDRAAAVQAGAPPAVAYAYITPAGLVSIRQAREERGQPLEQVPSFINQIPVRSPRGALYTISPQAAPPTVPAVSGYGLAAGPASVRARARAAALAAGGTAAGAPSGDVTSERAQLVPIRLVQDVPYEELAAAYLARQAVDPQSLRALSAETFYRATEWAGLYGWLTQTLIGGQPIERMVRWQPATFTSYSRAWWNLGAGGLGGEMCLTPDTLLQADWGRLVRADEVRVGDTLLNRYGEPQHVLAVHVREVDEEIREVRCYGSSIPLRATSEHPVWAIRSEYCENKSGRKRNLHCHPDCLAYKNGGCTTPYYSSYKPEWVPIKFLKRGDYVAYPIPRLPEQPSITTVDVYEVLRSTGDSCLILSGDGQWIIGRRGGKRGNPFPRWVPLTRELGRFFGFYLAEGGFGHRSGKRRYEVVFSFHRGEDEYRQFLLAFAWSLGVRGTEYEAPKSREFKGVRLCSSILAELLYALFGTKAEKRIPSWVFSTPKDFIVGLLQGIFQGDGHCAVYSPTKHVLELQWRAHAAAVQVFNLLLALGYHPSLRETEARNGAARQADGSVRPVIGTGPILVVRVYGSEAAQLAVLLDMASRGNSSRTREAEATTTEDDADDAAERARLVWSDGTWVYFPVRENRPVHYRGPVYDFTMDGDPSFLTICHAVHNSEILRRFVPREPGYSSMMYQYPELLLNPIRNRMPQWLPSNAYPWETPGGFSDYFIDFQRGDPYCVSPDTLIEVNGGGLKRADEVRPGDLVTTHTGRQVPVAAVAVRAVKPGEKVYRIRVASLAALPLVVSEEHPILVEAQGRKNGRPCGQVEWRLAKHIKPGDYVAYPLPNPAQGGVEQVVIDLADYLGTDGGFVFTESHVYWRGGEDFARAYEWLEAHSPPGRAGLGQRCDFITEQGWSLNAWKAAYRAYYLGTRVDRFPRHLAVDESLALLLGYYVAEGCGTGQDGRGVWFTFGKDEYAYHSDVKEALARLGLSVSEHPRGNALYLHVSCRPLAQLLRRMFGGHAREKSLPAWLACLPEPILVAFLRGLFNGDGHTCVRQDGKKVVVNLTTASLTLAYQVRLLLLRLGIPAGITRQRTVESQRVPPNGQRLVIKPRGDVYSVEVYGRAADRLRSVLWGLPVREGDPRYRPWVWTDDRYVYMRVLEVEEVGDVPAVIGFQVDADDSFVAAGVATHNTKIFRGEMRLPGPGYEALYGRPEIHLGPSLTNRSVPELVALLLGYRKDLSSFGRYVTEIGEEIHREYQRYWRKQGVLIGAEVPVAIPELGIKGYIDALLATSRGPMVVDVKSMSQERLEKALERGTPYEEHMRQIWMYQWMTGYTNTPGGLMYVSRDTGQEAWFEFPYNEQAVREELEKFATARRIARQLIAEGVVSPYETYPPLERYKILSSVAPWSEERRYYEQLLSSMREELSEEEWQEFQQAKREARERRRRLRLFPYRFRYADLQRETVTIERWLDANTFLTREHPNQPMRFAGLYVPQAKGDKIAEQARAFLEQELPPGTRITIGYAADPLRRYGTDQLKTLRVVVYKDLRNINLELIRRGMARERERDFTPAGVYARFSPEQLAVGRLWERFVHFPNILQTKFWPVRSPLEEYERKDVYGVRFARWETPIQSFVIPTLESIAAYPLLEAMVVGGTVGALSMPIMAGRSSWRGFKWGALFGATLSIARLAYEKLTGEAFIPRRRRQEREMELYFSALEYLKYRGLYEYARRRALEEEGIDVEAFFRRMEGRRRFTRAKRERLLEEKRARIEEGRVENAERIAEINYELRELAGWKELIPLTPWFASAIYYRQRYTSTIWGTDPYRADYAAIMRALPAKEREYFTYFVQAPAPERRRIEQIAPIYLRRFLQARWGRPVEPLPALEEFFRTHYLPPPDWEGWDIHHDLRDVKVRTLANEGFQLSEFGLWDQDKKRAEYLNAPALPVFLPTERLQDLSTRLRAILEGQGLTDVQVQITPSNYPGVRVYADVVASRHDAIVRYVRERFADVITQGG